MYGFHKNNHFHGSKPQDEQIRSNYLLISSTHTKKFLSTFRSCIILRANDGNISYCVGLYWTSICGAKINFEFHSTDYIVQLVNNIYCMSQ